MNLCYHIHSSVLKLPHFFTPRSLLSLSLSFEQPLYPLRSFMASHQRELRVFTVATTTEEASGSWWGYSCWYVCWISGVREKPNLALVTCDVGAVAAGPNASYLCVYCKKVLGSSEALESVDKALVSRLVVRVCVAAGAMEKSLCLDNILGSVVV
ncbi:hypothetical protein HID58_076308 [Brassica napus]|uniref:Uncharacterized protein n=1 Tax=Brassica napus TaxID=3708 RepID=A0ABQ7YM53_BRANA|nr:hypothetical protein HID58_076308 [Brassica napus]